MKAQLPPVPQPVKAPGELRTTPRPLPRTLTDSSALVVDPVKLATAVAVLFNGTGSTTLPITVAVSDDARRIARLTIVTVAVAPDVMVPIAQRMVGQPRMHTPALGVTDTTSSLPNSCGCNSVTPVAVTPLLAMVTR